MNTKNVIIYPGTDDIMENFVHQFWAEKQCLAKEPVCREITNEQIEELKNQKIPEDSRPLDDVIQEMKEEVFKYRYNVNHPRYLGFVPGLLRLCLGWEML